VVITPAQIWKAAGPSPIFTLWLPYNLAARLTKKCDMKQVSKTTPRLRSLLAVASLVAITCLSSCDKGLLQPTPTAPSGVNHNPSALPELFMPNVAYGPAPLQAMDIYLPAGRNNTTKVIVMIHGGGWMAGDKQDMAHIVPQLKAKWPEAAVVNINYRLTSDPAVHHQEIMNDIKAAVNYLLTNKTSLAVSDTLAMIGASAGAQLALLYTYTQNSNNAVKCVSDLFGPCVIDDWSWYNSFNIIAGKPVKEILTKYNGATWEANPAIYAANSPYRQVQANSKPTIIFHCNLDPVVPLYQSQWLNAKLGQLGVPHEYYEYIGFHELTPTQLPDFVDKTVSFFKRYIRQ
jgi:acetyl esterase/lipase